MFVCKKIAFSVILLLSSLMLLSSETYGSVDSTTPTVVVIPIKGTVDQGMAAFIARSLRDAAEEHPDRIIILEIDTYGGQVDAAFQIVDTMLNVKVPTIAYVKTKAISAGTLIALSCSKLYMKNNTTIGDVAPLTYDNGGPKMLGEKFQSPIRAKFRTLAKRNGYPERLTEAMVSEDISVNEVTFKDTVRYLDSTEITELSPKDKKNIISSKVIVKKGELLTMDDVEAKRLGFSRMSVESFDSLLSVLHLKKAEVVRIEESWSETFVRIIGTIAPVLIMIGFAALYIEIRTPGFGIPGIIGITCLAIVFFAQYMVGLADYTELLLIGIGLTLLAIEIFVLPGFGIAGFAGIFFLLIGVLLSFQDFVIPDPELPWETDKLIKNLLMITGSTVGSLFLIILFFKFLLPKIGTLVNGPYLQVNLRDASSIDNTKQLPHLGDFGVVSSPLRPAGKADINGETWDVISEGDFIEKGASVTVNQITGNKIIVRRNNA
ncbi:MAG TPA: NfeD family protein [Chitinispirillaceae bacterium]|nr:NfeD family protein [Chitinispirillaceae bacterium]